MLKRAGLVLAVVLAVSLVICQAAEQDDKNKAPKKPEKCSESNCGLPLCKCSETHGPSDIEIEDIPMMIALSFNGVVTTRHSKYIKRILNPMFKNPNGCGVQATFFVSETGNGTTDYCLVQTLFNNNNEIGVGSPKYTCPYTDCESQGKMNALWQWNEEKAEKNIFQQKRNIATKAKINQSFLRGFRLPILDQGGNSHFKALKKFGFNYDSSAIVKAADIRAHNFSRQWPHTLDFPPSYDCPTCATKDSLKCFKESGDNCTLNSVWIVPMHYFNVEERKSSQEKLINRTCSSLINNYIAEQRLDNKNCYQTNEVTERNLYEQLMDNFVRFYKPNKAPYVINIEMDWFEQGHGEKLTNALVQFINELTKPDEAASATSQNKNDVYFVTISKMIEWIQYPVRRDVIANKWLWDCDGVNYDYDEECESIKKLEQNALELEEAKKRNRTRELELKAEDLFRNGVLTSVVSVFLLSLLFTILYDKYH